MTITDCSNCGNRIQSDSKSGYCQHCKSPEQRARVNDAQRAIRAENIEKGFKYS
jgi:Zn finger protein HypA/HybF involved in hydrogenase expression